MTISPGSPTSGSVSPEPFSREERARLVARRIPSPDSSDSSRPVSPDPLPGEQQARLVAQRIPSITVSTGGAVSELTEAQQSALIEPFNRVKELMVGPRNVRPGEEDPIKDFEINFTFKTVSWTDANGVQQVKDIHEGLTSENVAIVDKAIEELTVFIENNVWKGLELKIFIQDFDPEHKGLSPADRQVRVIERHFESQTSSALTGPPTPETYTRLFADPAFTELSSEKRTRVLHRMFRLEKLMMTWKEVNNERDLVLDRLIAQKRQELSNAQEEISREPPPLENQRSALETQIAKLSQEIKKHQEEKEELESLNEKLEHVDLFALEKALLYYPTGAGILPEEVSSAAKGLANVLKDQVKGIPEANTTWERVKSLWYKYHGENEQPEYAHQVAGLLFSGLKPGQMRGAYYQFCEEQKQPMQEASLEDALVRWVLLSSTPAAFDIDPAMLADVPPDTPGAGSPPPPPPPAAEERSVERPESHRFSFAKKEVVRSVNDAMREFAPGRVDSLEDVEAERRRLRLTV